MASARGDRPVYDQRVKVRRDETTVRASCIYNRHLCDPPNTTGPQRGASLRTDKHCMRALEMGALEFQEISPERDRLNTTALIRQTLILHICIYE